MLNELLVVTRWCSVHKQSVVLSHIFRQEGIDLNPVVIAIDRFLLKLLVHLVLIRLVLQSPNNTREIIVRLLEHPLVREQFQRNIEELVWWVRI